MKAIMLSRKPKECANILNGDQSLIVRKTMPKCDLPIDVYIYCTKGNGLYLMNTYVEEGEYKKAFLKRWKDKKHPICNGKVVAKFTLNKVEEIEKGFEQGETMYDWFEGLRTKNLSITELQKMSCLTERDIYDYLDYYTKKSIYGYAWHIDNLEIFDKQKELVEFYKNGATDYINNCPKRLRFRCNGKGSGLKTTNCIKKDDMRLTKSPQSWCYVEVEK